MILIEKIGYSIRAINSGSTSRSFSIIISLKLKVNSLNRISELKIYQLDH
jgi:hypothetical protein